MDGYLSEYLPIAVFMALAIGLSIAFVVSALVVGSQKPDIEKLTAYECGFDAFDDSANPLMYVFIWSLSCLLSLT